MYWSLSTAKGTLRYAYCSDSRSLLPYYIRALFPVVSALPQARSGEPSIVCLFYGIVGLFYKYNMSLLPLCSVSFPPILGIFWTPFAHLRKPKPQTGKTLRNVIRSIADGEPYKLPGTIEDASVIGGVEAAIASIGYGSARR